MRIPSRRRAIVLFITLGVCMVALATTLQFGWIILNWRRLVPLVLGIPFFALLIAGVYSIRSSWSAKYAAMSAMTAF